MNYKLFAIAFILPLCLTASNLMAMEKENKQTVNRARICINDGPETSFIDLDDESHEDISRFNQKAPNNEQNKLLVKEEKVEQSPPQQIKINIACKIRQDKCWGLFRIIIRNLNNNLNCPTIMKDGQTYYKLPKPYKLTVENEDYHYTTFRC